MDIKYRTPFHLADCVNDFYAAQEYLTEDDMTEYLKESLDDSCTYFELPMAHLKDKVKHIEWHLTSGNEGYIELTATEEIPQVELDQISEWVSGQCSDGLGESFEQQPFANWVEDEFYDEDNMDYCAEDYIVMCSFDWQTNKYIFSRYED